MQNKWKKEGVLCWEEGKGFSGNMDTIVHYTVKNPVKNYHVEQGT